jgi:predicted N-acetyltransferase YhbS
LGGDGSFFNQSRHWHGSAPEYSVVGRIDGALAGHVGIIVRTIRCGAEQVRIAGIQNFGVLQAFRGAGVGHWLMDLALREAARRQIPFGLLFCIPQLEKYYASMGWRTTREPVTMNLYGGPDEPIPAKNIGMYFTHSGEPLPPGPIHLQGPDW